MLRLRNQLVWAAIVGIGAMLIACEPSPSASPTTPAQPASPKPAESKTAAPTAKPVEGASQGQTDKPAAASPSPKDLQNISDMVRANAPAPTLPANHPPTQATPALPPNHPPMGGAPTSRVAGVPVPPTPESPLKLEAPQGWTSKPPRNAMRRAEFIIPRAAGDSEDGEAALFYFGAGDGGDVQSNLARWQGMFQTAEGKPLGAEAVKTEKIKAGDMPLTIIELMGRYAPSAMAPGAPTPAAKDDQVMIGAVIESPHGNYFFRAVGPAKTMQSQREACIQMLKTAKL